MDTNPSMGYILATLIPEMFLVFSITLLLIYVLKMDIDHNKFILHTAYTAIMFCIIIGFTVYLVNVFPADCFIYRVATYEKNTLDVLIRHALIICMLGCMLISLYFHRQK